MGVEALALLAGAIIGSFVYGFLSYLLKNDGNIVKMETELKQAVLSLFLYAEKRGWTDEEKMAYVAHKLYDIIPGETINQVIAGEHLTDYLQRVYQEVKSLATN